MAEFLSDLVTGFTGAAEDAVTARNRRTRLDARTVGYPTDDPSRIVWMGMGPIGDDGDLWRVGEAEEEANEYLIQVKENQRLLNWRWKDFKPMSFEQAVEKLARWEMIRMMKGVKPVAGHDVEDIGPHYFRDLAKVRLLMANATTGETSDSPGGFLPDKSGTYLKSDVEAMATYQDELKGGDTLSELFRAQDPLYINDASAEENIRSFGEINMLNDMRFFAEILVEYARVKLGFIEEFYGNPTALNRQGLYERLNESRFFSDELIARYNELRGELAPFIFRFFHVAKADWDMKLDFNDERVLARLFARPGAKATYDMLVKEVEGPLDEKETEALLTVAARALLYFREQLKDSAQKDALEREDIYKQSDILDLLNFLDLLNIKYDYAELAEGSKVLHGTKMHERLEAKTADFSRRVEKLKKNLTGAGNFSAAQERQIDDFIKASAPVYLVERIAKLPERLGAAYEFIAKRILPRQHQLSLDLDYTQGRRIAAPTRRVYEEMRQEERTTPQPG